MRARRRFGQHFLEPVWADRLVAAIAASPDDVFLEIGPGHGALTRPLARVARQIVAVEIDRDLAGAGFPPNVRIVQGDVLDVDLDAVLEGLPRPIRVVGNLPYNVASPILFMLLDAAGDGRRFRDATLMMQKEVADRVSARPGSRDYGSLSVQVGLVADVDTLMTLPPGAFRPAPKVISTVVRLRFRAPTEDVGDRAAFESLVRGVFLHRRKTVANALKYIVSPAGRTVPELLERAGVDGALRPEQLSLSDFARLCRAVL